MSRFDYLLNEEQEAYDNVIKLINQYVMEYAQNDVINALDELVKLLTRF